MSIKAAPPSLGCIAPIFRSPFLEKVARGKHTPALLELGALVGGLSLPSRHDTLANWFEFLYGLLLERYRCEYVYKNTIANKLFLSRHSLRTSFMTDELRSAGSRADLAILNGTSTVYEIKTKYDSFDRLATQVLDYKKIFDRIYVVTTGTKVDLAIQVLDPEIGVIAMRENGSLGTVREALSNKQNVSPAAVFDCMRQSEFCAAVKEALGEVPRVPNSQLYSRCRELFCSLPPTLGHDLMVRQIKKRGKGKAFADLIDKAPPSLKHACLSFSRSVAMANAITARFQEPLI